MRRSMIATHRHHAPRSGAGAVTVLRRERGVHLWRQHRRRDGRRDPARAPRGGPDGLTQSEIRNLFSHHNSAGRLGAALGGAAAASQGSAGETPNQWPPRRRVVRTMTKSRNHVSVGEKGVNGENPLAGPHFSPFSPTKNPTLRSGERRSPYRLSRARWCCLSDTLTPTSRKPEGRGKRDDE
jgi:hypothetical protein